MLTAVAALLTVLVLYLCGTSGFGYWKRKGVKHDRPVPFFGNCARNFLMQKSLVQLLVETYWRYPSEPVVGLYRAHRPVLLIRDPEIAKRILVTDFHHFHARGINPHQKVIEPMFRNLFFVDGDTWRLLRQRMTPAFSTGKLKAMFPLITERAERLQARLLAAARVRSELDARDLMARYTTDFIGACGFGIDTDSLNDQNSAFRQMGAKIFSPTKKTTIYTFLKLIFPETFKYAKTLEEVEVGITALVKDIMTKRNNRPSGRNDFIDLLLECRSKGLMVGESIERFKADGTPELASLELDDVLLAAQAFVFFAAGFETSSSASSFTLHQLAHHPDLQRKVQAEIDSVLAKHNNKLCYEAVREMTYLESVARESMRMFPPLGILYRRCVRKYTIPEINLTIDSGVQVVVPLQAMHNDPQYFESPQQFRPERFQRGAAAGGVYLPFGAGPRACVGERMGLMQTLAGLAAVLMVCRVEPGPRSTRELRVSPMTSIVQTISGGIPLVFRERDAATHLLTT